MSGPAQKGPIGDALARIAELAQAGGADVALIGATARRAHGSGESTEAIDVAATVAVAVDEGAPLHLGGVAFGWQGVAVHWLVRADEFAPLYATAIAAAVSVPGWPLKVVRPEHLAAMMLATRRAADHERLIVWIAAGHLDKDTARAAVLQHLGPYAVGDFETLLQEAEWRAMRQRYEGDGDLH